MKHTLIIILALSTLTASAQDYFLCYTNTPSTNATREAYWVDLGNRKSDDVREWRERGLPEPGVFPAVVDATSGDYVQMTGTVRQAIRDLRAMQRVAVTNESPGWFQAFTMTTNTMFLIGAGRSGFGLLRYDGTKLTAAQREQYQTECIQYLAARVQLLERELKRKKVVNIKPLVEDAP
jgi:hypothetical protein